MAEKTKALPGYIARQGVRADAIDEAVLAAESGEFISHEAMSVWLNSWGTDHEVAPPKADVIKAKR